MKVRIIKGDFTAEQPQEDNVSPGLGDLKSSPHGGSDARRIDNHRGKLAEMLLQFPGQVRICPEWGTKLLTVAGKIQATGLSIDTNHMSACRLREDGGGKPDRAEADNDRRLATFYRGAFQAVGTNDEGFHQRDLLRGLALDALMHNFGNWSNDHSTSTVAWPDQSNQITFFAGKDGVPV